MTRLFVQLFVAILVAVLLSFVIDIILFDHAMEREFREDAPPFVIAVGAAIQHQLEDVETANLPAELEGMRTESGMPIELSTLHDERIDDARRSVLSNGRTAHHMAFRPGPTLFIPIGDERVVIVGPVGDFPTPGIPDALLMLTVVLLVVGVVCMVVTYPLVRQLRSLESATGRLAEGDLDARVRMRGGGPIGDVGRRFDDMADTIQDLLKRQRELVQAVAHEIRTPISRIRYGLEMAAIAESSEEREACEAGVEEDLEELNALVAELLIYTRHDSGTAKLAFEGTVVTELVEGLVERQREHYTDLELEVDIPSSAEISVHRRSFQRALRNLVLNACRHAERRVMVRTVNEDDALVVEIHDDGPGVPPDMRERIFDPFARTDTSRSRELGGVGLGLAIVRRILSAHRGTVEVGESPLSGALFITRWPRHPRTPADS